EAEIDRIPRPPYAPFPVNKTFQSLLNLTSAYIEATERKAAAVIEFQVTALLAFPGDQKEGFPLGFKMRHTRCVAFSLFHYLLLVIKQFQLHSRNRLGREQVGYRNPHFVAGAPFND